MTEKTQDGIKIGAQLMCGCCGQYFRVCPGYRDQDQDKGYGICQSCQAWIAEKDRAQEDRMLATLREGLNEANRARFDSMDRDLQLAFVGKAIEDGILSFSIRKF